MYTLLLYPKIFEILFGIQMSEDASISELHVFRELPRSFSFQMEYCSLFSSQLNANVPRILLDYIERLFEIFLSGSPQF